MEILLTRSCRPCTSYLLALVLALGAPAWATPPETVNIHGALMDADGAPLSGARAYVVRFFDAETGGSQLGGDVTGSVLVSPEGLFNLPVLLPASALAAPQLWYELGIDTDTPPDGDAEDDIFPDRIRVHSVPFALEAGEVAYVDAARIGYGTVSNTEFNHLAGVTQPLQPALDAKADAADLAAHTGNLGNPHAVSKAQVGLGNVDNTADLDKPVSTATQAALDAKADDTDLAAHTGDLTNPHAVTAAQVGLGNVDNTADLDKPVSTATQAALDAKIPRSSEAYVVVEVASDATTNSENLRAAYAAAKMLTPFGNALSATNRAAVIVPPGRYDLGSEALTMDTDFVDLIGLSTGRENQYIRCIDNVLIQTAGNVRIENLVFHQVGGLDMVFAYYPNATWGVGGVGSPPGTRIRNCEFRSSDMSMRPGVEYAGIYEDCSADAYAFGAYGMASGKFINCIGGQYAFGGGGVASGAFLRCTGGTFSFGGGDNGTASGTFINCTGDSEAFSGAFGAASGTFAYCIGGPYSFGGSSFGNASDGEFYHCIGGENSFTTTGSPIVLYCVRNGVAYP